jgi:hypothetical protein
VLTNRGSGAGEAQNVGQVVAIAAINSFSGVIERANRRIHKCVVIIIIIVVIIIIITQVP